TCRGCSRRWFWRSASPCRPWSRWRSAAWPRGACSAKSRSRCSAGSEPPRRRAIMAAVTPPSGTPLPPLRPWQRLSVRVAGLFVAVTLLAVGLVGEILYERQKRETEATLAALLLNVARTGAYLVDPQQHLVVQRTLTQQTSAYLSVRRALA